MCTQWTHLTLVPILYYLTRLVRVCPPLQLRSYYPQKNYIFTRKSLLTHIINLYKQGTCHNKSPWSRNSLQPYKVPTVTQKTMYD